MFDPIYGECLACGERRLLIWEWCCKACVQLMLLANVGKIPTAQEIRDGN